MSSPLYQQLNPQSNNLISLIQEFKTNPMAVIAKRYNLPDGMNDPNQIIQHLLNSGQVTQAQVNRAIQMSNNPQLRNLLK